MLSPLVQLGTRDAVSTKTGDLYQRQSYSLYIPRILNLNGTRKAQRQLDRLREIGSLNLQATGQYW